MANYGADSELLGLVADKQALQLAFPLDSQRAMANDDVLRALRRQGLADDDITALGAEATKQLKRAENCYTLAHFFGGFLAPEMQQISRRFAAQAEASLQDLPLMDDAPRGGAVFEAELGLG